MWTVIGNRKQSLSELRLQTGIRLFCSPQSPVLPIPHLTPGSIVCINKEALFANSGYAETHRDVSRLTKHRVFRRYNIAPKHRHLYHIDHLIPLSLGGSNDFRNLWPHQHDKIHGPTAKARLEAKQRTLVKRQIITRPDAQQALRLNWVEAMEKLGVV